MINMVLGIAGILIALPAFAMVCELINKGDGIAGILIGLAIVGMVCAFFLAPKVEAAEIAELRAKGFSEEEIQRFLDRKRKIRARISQTGITPHHHRTRGLFKNDIYTDPSYSCVRGNIYYRDRY